MLKNKLRLKRNKEFSYIYRKGGKTKGRYVSIYAIKGSREMKIGFSLSKKVGNAVIRNLYKRRLHEIFKDLLPTMKVSKYIVVASPSIREASFQDLKADVLAAVRRMNSLP